MTAVIIGCIVRITRASALVSYLRGPQTSMQKYAVYAAADKSQAEVLQPERLSTRQQVDIHVHTGPKGTGGHVETDWV